MAEQPYIPPEIQAALTSLNRAIFLRESKQAAAVYRDILARDPKFLLRPPVQYDLARLLELGGELELALAAYEKIVRDMPGHTATAPTLRALGHIAFRLQKFGDAYDYLAKFLETNPLTPERVEAEDVMARIPPAAKQGKAPAPKAFGDAPSSGTVKTGDAPQKIPGSSSSQALKFEWKMPAAKKPKTEPPRPRADAGKPAPLPSTAKLPAPEPPAERSSINLGSAIWQAAPPAEPDPGEKLTSDAVPVFSDAPPPVAPPPAAAVPPSGMPERPRGRGSEAREEWESARGPRPPAPPAAKPPLVPLPLQPLGDLPSTDKLLTPRPVAPPPKVIKPISPPPPPATPANPLTMPTPPPFALTPTPVEGMVPHSRVMKLPDFAPPPPPAPPRQSADIVPIPASDIGRPSAIPKSEIPAARLAQKPSQTPVPPAARVTNPAPKPPAPMLAPMKSPSSGQVEKPPMAEIPMTAGAPFPAPAPPPKPRDRETPEQRYDRLRDSQFALILPLGKRIHLDAVAELFARWEEVDEATAKKRVLRRKGILFDELTFSELLELTPLVKTCRQALHFVAVPRALRPYEAYDVRAAERRPQGLKIRTEHGIQRVRWEDIRLINCGLVGTQLVATIHGCDPMKEFRFLNDAFNYAVFAGKPGELKTNLAEFLRYIKDHSPNAVLSFTADGVLTGKMPTPQAFATPEEYSSYSLWLIFSNFGEAVDPRELIEISRATSNW